MMSKEDQNKPVEPTKSELEILQVLWEIGPSTVRTVNDVLQKQKDVNYATTLKFMQIMAEKGMLIRDESQMKHIYSVAEEEQKTKSHLLEKFVDSMYKGSVSWCCNY
jgi:BlaI family penicillinase repressor